MRRAEEQTRRSERPAQMVYVLDSGVSAERLFVLASVAMRPELLTSPQMREIVEEFQALKACAH